MPTRYICLAIFLLSFGIRAVQLPALSTRELTFSTMTPAGPRSYDEGINIALSLVAGRGFADPFWSGPTGPSAHCAPAFPVVTAALLSVFGTGTSGAVARNLLNIGGYALLFALLPVFAVRLGMTRLPGTVAGFAAAIYPLYGLREISRGRDEWLAALAAMALLLYALKAARSDQLAGAAALAWGAGWGALMYVHPAMILILPLHLLIVLFARSRPAAQRLAFTGILCAALLLVILPWTIRNRLVMGGWMFMRDDAGLELEVSNGTGSRPSLNENNASGWFCSIHPNCNPAIATLVREMGERNFNRQALANAVAWIHDEPGDFAALTLHRAIAFWFGLRSTPVLFGLKAAAWLLGLCGLVWMWRAGLGVESALLGAVWLAYPMTFYVIQYVERYPAPIAPAILLPAGFAAVKLYLNLRNSMLSGSKN